MGSALAVLRSLLGTAALMLTGGAAPVRFAICYGPNVTIEELAPYQLVVLDADHHPPVALLRARGTAVFGYLSVGEADQDRAYFPAVVAADVLLGTNPAWPRARYVDLRRPAWRAVLLDQVIPAVLAQGFDGLFLDTLDDAGFLEQADPVANRGMVAAGADLVRAIRARYPAVPLMLNRAFDVGALVAHELDAVLGESLASTYDFKSRRYHVRTEADLRWGLARMAALRELNPQINLYSLDYWDPNDIAGTRRLYERERRAGFVPYVATIDLQRVLPEPGMGRVAR